MAASKIIDLRNLLAERFPQSPVPIQPKIATGLAGLDEITGGGLLKGAITELTSPGASAGSALMIHGLLRSAVRERYFLALIDGRDSFDPEAFENVALHNLLWVRCRKTLDAVKAADLLLRDGNFPLVVLDLILNGAEELRKIPQTCWFRLQRLVEPASTAFLILTPHSVISSAQMKLVLDNNWTLYDLQQAQGNFSRLKINLQRIHGGRQNLAGAG